MAVHQSDSDSSLQEQWRERAWTIAQRAVTTLVAVLAGLFIGHHLWGQAGALRAQVVHLQERLDRREQERDTLQGQLAISERDRRELERSLQSAQARCGLPTAAPAPIP